MAAAALRRRRTPAAPLALVRPQNRPGAGRSALPEDAVAIVCDGQRNRALVTSVWPVTARLLQNEQTGADSLL